MRVSFKRITSTGLFIPEIDGLRFVAIAIVVLQHLHGFLSVKAPELRQSFAWADFVYFLGPLGVPLFFVISGFILALPYARYHLKDAARPKLRDFYLRRVTRLEPPYIAAMTLLLIGAVFVAQTMAPQAALKSYGASLLYLHNILFPGRLPDLNPAAWSLEVEVQFYLLAPFLTYVFAIRSAVWRRLFLTGAALLFIYLNVAVWQPYFTSLYTWIAYFLAGFLLADLYLSQVRLLPVTRADGLLALGAATGTACADLFTNGLIAQTAILACLLLFFYYIVIHRAWKFLTLPFFTTIGGMCYSIYLLHYAVISAVGNPMLSQSLALPLFVKTILYFCILLCSVLFISGIFFLLIERPCMKKGWYKF